MNNHSKMKSNKIGRIVSIGIVLFFILMSCTPRDKEATSEDTQASRGKRPGKDTYIFSVNASTVTPTYIEEILSIGGSVQSVKEASVIPDTSGTLTRILVDEGDKVKKNQILLYVDPSKAGQSFLPSPVKAPFTGIVSSLPTKIGNSVSSQQVVAVISDDSELEMKIAVPEGYVTTISLETKGNLLLSSLSGESFPMRIKSLSSVLSPNTHTMSVTMAFEERDERIKSGMYGTLELITERKDEVLVVSRDVIQIRVKDSTNQLGVFLVKDVENSAGGENEDVKQAVFQLVSIGLESRNQVEVSSGLTAGDVVITTGQSLVSNESFVRVFSKDGETLISEEEELQKLN